MDERVAPRYAMALFQTAQQQSIVPSVSDDLNAISAALKSDPRFSAFLDNPTLNRASKLKVLETVFSDRVTALTMHFLRLLLDKRRENLIGRVTEEFNRLRRESENSQHIIVSSAMELSQDEKTAIVRKIEVKSGKLVEADFHIDPALIGGVKVAMGNYVLDGTIKGSLAKLKDRLLYDVLKQI